MHKNKDDSDYEQVPERLASSYKKVVLSGFTVHHKPDPQIRQKILMESRKNYSSAFKTQKNRKWKSPKKVVKKKEIE